MGLSAGTGGGRVLASYVRYAPESSRGTQQLHFRWIGMPPPPSPPDAAAPVDAPAPDTAVDSPPDAAPDPIVDAAVVVDGPVVPADASEPDNVAGLDGVGADTPIGAPDAHLDAGAQDAAIPVDGPVPMDAAVVTDAGGDARPRDSTGEAPGGDDGEGCTCRLGRGGRPSGGSLALLLTFAFVFIRRSRRAGTGHDVRQADDRPSQPTIFFIR